MIAIQKERIYRNIRILEVNSTFLIGASGYRLYKIINGECILFAKLKDCKFALLSKIKLTRRLFRAEVHEYKSLKNNNGICIAKKGIFLENKTTGKFEKVFHILRGSRPMTLCEDQNGNLFFGEYYSNQNRREVHIYSSSDSGKSWTVIYTFPSKMIRHIHSIQLDPYTGFLWIATGDKDGECIIAYTKDGFQSLEIVAKGGQEFRTCKFLFFKEKIVYGSDSPYIENYIKAINRSDNSIQPLQKVQGSVINACQIGSKGIISTTVEPSEINRERNSYLWISDDSIKWFQVCSYKKDFYNGSLFQFGSIRFPHYNIPESDSIFFSGHALSKIDGHSTEFMNFKNMLS